MRVSTQRGGKSWLQPMVGIGGTEEETGLMYPIRQRPPLASIICRRGAIRRWEGHPGLCSSLWLDHTGSNAQSIRVAPASYLHKRQKRVSSIATTPCAIGSRHDYALWRNCSEDWKLPHGQASSSVSSSNLVLIWQPEAGTLSHGRKGNFKGEIWETLAMFQDLPSIIPGPSINSSPISRERQRQRHEIVP